MGQFPSCSCGDSGSEFPLVACDGTAGEESVNVHVCNTDPIPVSIEDVDVTVNVDVGPSVEISNDDGNPIPVSGTVTANTADTHAEDTAHASGDIGSFALGVRNDAAATRTSADGDYTPLSTDAAGRIGIADLGGSITVDGTFLTDAQLRATPVPISGTVTVTDGSGPLTVDGSITAAEAKLEDAAAANGDAGIPALAVRNDTGAVKTSADGDYSMISTDSAGRVGISDLGGSISIDDNGGSITVDGTVTATTADTKAEDAPHSSGDTGSFALGVRNDAAAVRTSADGDYSPLSTDSAGRLGISDLGGSISIDDNGGSITVDGTVTATDAKTEDAAHASGDIGSFALGVRNDAAAVRTSADGDYSPLSTDSAGRIGIADLGGSISIDDNGGSLTVDGTVAATQSGTWTVVDSPVTSGGLSCFRDIDLDESGPANIKASAGQVYGWYLYNNSAVTIYVKLYNKATAPVIASDSALIVMTIPIPAGSAANVEFSKGIAFSSGIGWTATTGVGDTNTGAPAVNDLVGNLLYK